MSRVSRADKVVSPAAAAAMVADGATLATGGFVGIGVPEELLVALEARFVERTEPRDESSTRNPKLDT